MLHANSEYPSIKLFIYMDSDAVINKKFVDFPINSFLSTMQTKLKWDPVSRPIVFNQDGPSWWCKVIVIVCLMVLCFANVFFCQYILPACGGGWV